MGGLSSKLEKRREKLRQMKDDAMNIDKEASKATEKKEEQKVDTSKDKANEAESVKEETIDKT